LNQEKFVNVAVAAPDQNELQRRYQNRLLKVIEHVDAHLDAALSVDELSSIAAFSKFHFHRQFYEFFGLNVSKFVQLVRLNRAAQQLAYRDDSVTDIALVSGYESPEAFARVFRKVTAQSPSEFRKQPNWNTWFNTYQSVRELRVKYMSLGNQKRVTVVNTNDINVAALEYRGNPDALGNSIRIFIEWRKQQKLHPSKHATFNILYDDPESVDPKHYRIDLCVASEIKIPDNTAGIISKTIPGGRCASIRHIGSEDLLRSSISYLYSTWLPTSGEELRDFPLYLQRVKFFPDVPEHEAIVDIFLPLK